MKSKVSKSLLTLSNHQYRIIDDLGIDAWYLKPLRREFIDPQFQASQNEIAEIVASLTVENISPKADETIAINTPPASKKPPKLDALGSDAITKTAGVENNSVSRFSLQRIAIFKKNFEPVRLNPNLDLSPPQNSLVHFPYNDKKVNPTLSSIEESVKALNDNDVGVEMTQVLSGTGNHSPKWLFIMPPPTLPHLKNQQILNDDETILLKEVLSSVGKTWDDIYITPLVKQVVYKQKDPNSILLEKHLPVLAAEIAYLKADHIFLMGRLPSQVLLSTKSPLSGLINNDFKLQLEGKKYPLSVLPSLHYFLSLPVDKSILWQRIKLLS